MGTSVHKKSGKSSYFFLRVYLSGGPGQRQVRRPSTDRPDPRVRVLGAERHHALQRRRPSPHGAQLQVPPPHPYFFNYFPFILQYFIFINGKVNNEDERKV